LVIRDPELVGGKREAKVGLRERGDIAAKDLSHRQGHAMINVHGDESGFVKIYMEASGTREGIQDKIEVPDRGGVPFDQDKRVICIPEDRAAEAVHEGMTDVAIGGRFLEESLQDIGDDNKEVRGNRVALTKASAALEPAPRHATPVRRMDVLPVRSVLAIQEHHRSPKPHERRMKSRLSQEIESKAFLKSSFRTTVGAWRL